MHYSSNLRLSNMEMQFSFMSIDFGEIGKICDMPAVIRKYIYNYEDFTDYYLCLCDELGQRQKEHVSHYTDKMHLRVGFHNREVMSAPVWKTGIPHNQSMYSDNEPAQNKSIVVYHRSIHVAAVPFVKIPYPDFLPELT